MLIRHRMTRAASAGALLLGLTALTSCGFNAATDQPYTPGVGTNQQEGQVDVLNAMIVASEQGRGTFVATIVNNETPQFEDGALSNVDDELTRIESTDGGVSATFDPIPIRGNDYTKISADEGRADVDVAGIKVTGSEIKIGNFVTLELSFDNADTVTIEVPVVANNGHFEGQDDGEVVPTDKPGYGGEGSGEESGAEAEH